MIRRALVVLLAAVVVAACAALGDARKILVLAPSLAFLRLEKGGMVRVGSYLDEVAVPTMAMLDQGWSVTFATLGGNPPPLDPRSNASSYFPSSAMYERALTFWRTNPSLNKPRRLTDFAVESPDAPINATSSELDSISAVFIPGGHAPIEDLRASTAAARILAHMVEKKKVIGAICHGPLVLASLALLRQPWPFAGKNMTVFSTEEEKIVEAKVWGGRKLGFYPPDVLAGLGGKMVEAPGFGSNIVIDGRLLTGQNPASAYAFAAAFLKMWN